MDNSLISLQKQVNLIWLSKVIKDPIILKQKTGLNLIDIHKVLQNENYILEKWKQDTNNDNEDWDGIDAILLEWIKCYKVNNVKLMSTTFNSHVKHLSQLLEISSYYIRPKVWANIYSILNNETTIIMPAKPLYRTPGTILKEDDCNFLKPHIYYKFLSRVKKNSSMEVNSPNSSTNKQASTSTHDIESNNFVCIENPTYSQNVNENIVKVKTETLSSPQLLEQDRTNNSSFIEKDFQPQKRIKLVTAKGMGITKENYNAETNQGAVLMKKEINDNFLEEEQNRFQEFPNINKDNEIYSNQGIKHEDIDETNNTNWFEIIDGNEALPLINNEIKQELEIAKIDIEKCVENVIIPKDNFVIIKDEIEQEPMETNEIENKNVMNNIKVKPLEGNIEVNNEQHTLKPKSLEENVTEDEDVITVSEIISEVDDDSHKNSQIVLKQLKEIIDNSKTQAECKKNQQKFNTNSGKPNRLLTNFEPTKHHIREVLLYFFHAKQSAALAYRMLTEAYSKNVPSVSTCERWFVRFRNGNYDMEDKERPGKPKKFKDDELQALLNEDSSRTQKQLAKLLGTSQAAISKRLKAAGFMQKEGNWVPHDSK